MRRENGARRPESHADIKNEKIRFPAVTQKQVLPKPGRVEGPLTQKRCYPIEPNMRTKEAAGYRPGRPPFVHEALPPALTNLQRFDLTTGPWEERLAELRAPRPLVNPFGPIHASPASV